MSPIADRPRGLLVAASALLLLECTHPPQPGSPTQDAAPAVVPAASVKPPVLAPAAINDALRAAWQAQKLTPTPHVDDARFLRRLYLDIVGVIPPSPIASAFAADTAPDKRDKAVDALLASPAYAEHWANYWDRVLLGKEVRARLVNRDAFRSFLRGELAANVGYDKMVYELITASGQSSADDASGAPTKVETQPPAMGTAAPSADPASPSPEPVNGAVNWFVKYVDSPQDLAGATSKLFLGVQIQCAQCHDHKTEKWKTVDFQRFAACFAETKIRPIDQGMGKGKRYEVGDTRKVGFYKKRKEPEIKAIAASPPVGLDGTDFSSSENRRQALAKWITAPANPWFSQAIVNRIWAHFLGRGFVDPITDFRPSNPPAMPEMLKLLADDFVANGYDLKHLIKLITMSEVYALAPSTEKDAGSENKLWAHFRVEPLAPDELLDSIVVATNLAGVLDRNVFGKGIEEVRAQLDKQFSFLFDVDEESDTEDFDGTIPQALFLLNGQFSNNNSRGIPGSTLAEILAMPEGDAPKIRALYLRALSREPTADEIATWTEFVNTPRAAVDATADPAADANKNKKDRKKGGDAGKKNDRKPAMARRQAYEDLFWALLNSSEFAFNH